MADYFVCYRQSCALDTIQGAMTCFERAVDFRATYSSASVSDLLLLGC